MLLSHSVPSHKGLQRALFNLLCILLPGMNSYYKSQPSTQHHQWFLLYKCTKLLEFYHNFLSLPHFAIILPISSTSPSQTQVISKSMLSVLFPGMPVSSTELLLSILFPCYLMATNGLVRVSVSCWPASIEIWWNSVGWSWGEQKGWLSHCLHWFSSQQLGLMLYQLLNSNPGWELSYSSRRIRKCKRSINFTDWFLLSPEIFLSLKNDVWGTICI